METLFAVSFGAKFAVKKADAAKDYTVMPPEGLWWMNDMSQFSVETKDRWKWTLMIMQPEFVTSRVIEQVSRALRERGKGPALDSMRFAPYDEGTAVQIMHVGPFDAEGPAIEKMHEFARQQGYQLRGKHHEIYLSDPRRAAPEKLKTILRQPVTKG